MSDYDFIGEIERLRAERDEARHVANVRWEEVRKLVAVVAAQREALRECDAVIAVMTSYMDDLLDRARAANTPSLTRRDSAGPFGHYAQARLEELVGKVSALVVARRALDAEGVSEPGRGEPMQGQGERGHTGEDAGTLPAAPAGPDPGSLTSPVDTTPGAKK